jgi:hypothetical protein
VPKTFFRKAMYFAFRSFDYKDSIDLIESILGVKSSSKFWFSFESDFEGRGEFLSDLFARLHKHSKTLMENKIDLSDFCLWIFIDTGLNVQQNYEFSPEDQSILAKYGITLCISA